MRGMYVEAFTNWNFESRTKGYVQGDELELCYRAERPDLDELDAEEAAQIVFQDLNHDDKRANAGLFPALSIGDIVSYRTDNIVG